MYVRLAHVCLHATDLKEAQSFYCDGLGLEKGFTFEKDGELFGFYLNLGNSSFIEVFKGNPGMDGAIKHLAIEVDSMDDTLSRLMANGIEVTEKKLGRDNSWQAWITAPDGVRIELHEYTKESMQLTGGVCRF